jgi:hypothetical protein
MLYCSVKPRLTQLASVNLAEMYPLRFAISKCIFISLAQKKKRKRSRQHWKKYSFEENEVASQKSQPSEVIETEDEARRCNGERP